MTQWLKIAWEGEGVTETRGAAATPEILRYFRDAGREDITSDEISWCAAFVFACLAHAGMPPTLAAADRLLARSYLKVGTPIDTPRVGAIVVFWRGSPNSWQGHTGFVVGETATHIKVLGGNQANSVTVASYPKSRVLGYRWPAPPATPKEVAGGSRIASAAKQQQGDAVKSGGVLGIGEVIPAPPDQLPGVDTLAQSAGEFTGLVTGLQSFLLFGWAKAWWIVAAIAAYWVLRILWNSGRIRWWRTDDANTGKSPVADSAAPAARPLDGEILDPVSEEAAHA